MKNLKLILKSLFSNNACIDGGRKKPWFFAAIMLFLSMVFAILPLFVQTIKIQGDDVFQNYAYGTDVALVGFNEYLDENGIEMSVKTSASGEKFIASVGGDNQPAEFGYTHKRLVVVSDRTVEEQNDFMFFYRTTIDETEFKTLIGDQKTSFMFFSQDRIIMHLVNFETKETIKDLICQEAAKYLEEGKSINEMLSTSEDNTTKLTETFNNWKLFIRDAYNFTRLTSLWQTCAIMGGINVGITLFMGFMIWILTRGKNNPYRLTFNLWNTQKTAWWAAITPSILALAFGFLLPRFANILFPMLIGIRVMWLSMKSLRPDGSGYASAD